MSRKFGFDLLVEQTAAEVERQVGLDAAFAEQGGGLGDTPIEKLFFLALRKHVKYGDNIVEYDLVVCRDASDVSEAMVPETAYRIIIGGQVEISDLGRVDFLILSYATCERGLEIDIKPSWRRLIVECDGHAFHERTKEQAAKDRSRDRAAALAGYEVFRFTGSELWRDPWGCADQVVQWVNRGI